MNPPAPRAKVTIEDLLRVKRAERPLPEFWDRFESELRAKQLAAIVGRRPWWRVSARLPLPLGAAAALALTFLAAHEYRRPGAQPAAPLPVSPARLAVTPGSAPADAVSPAAFVAFPVEAIAAAPATVVAGRAEAPLPVSTVRPGEISEAISLLGSDARAGEKREVSPSARFIAANLAMAQAADPDLVASSLGTLPGFENRAMPARPVEPLAQLPTPRDQHSARYLSTSLPGGYALEASASRPSERLRSRINERQITEDGGGRFGFDNGSVLFKF